MFKKLTEDVEADPGRGRHPHAVLGRALVDAAVVPTHVAHPQRQAGLVDDLRNWDRGLNSMILEIDTSIHYRVT